MARLSYVLYLYIKANTHQTHLKFAKAIEEIQSVQRDLPLHLSPSFPANEDDRQWESEHPWIPFQRYLITYVLDFLLLSIARVLIPKKPEDDPTTFRQLALQCANRILEHYATPVPRVYRLVWTVSAATVAAAIYMALDDYRGDARIRIINLLRQASTELGKHSVVAVHAAKGNGVLEGLLPLLEHNDFEFPRVPRTIHDLLQQLSTAQQDVLPTTLPNPAAGLDSFTHVGNYEDINMFNGLENTMDGNFDLNEWDNVFSQL